MAAVKAVVADRVAVLARLKEIPTVVEPIDSISPQLVSLKSGEGEPLVEVLETVAKWKHRSAYAGWVHIVHDGLEAVNPEVLVLVAVELGVTAGVPVVTQLDKAGWLILYDPRDQVRPGTFVAVRPDGFDQHHQHVEKRLGCARFKNDTDIPKHPDDEAYEQEKAGIRKKEKSLRELLEEYLASIQ